MAPDSGRALRRLTFLLVAVASAATEVAADDLRPVWHSLGLAAGWVALAALVSAVVRPPADPAAAPPKWVAAVVACLGALPFLVEPLRRAWAGVGYPLELQMVAGFRNMALGFAACAAWRVCLRLAGAASLFLVLFAVIMTDHAATAPLLGLYCAAGSVWLAAAHWAGLRKYFAEAAAATPLVLEAGPNPPVPKLAALVLVIVAGGLVAVAVAGPRRVVGSLGELFPSSGGTGEFDPFARKGVGDGDDETAGENANSTGMTASDTFLETPLPSLYDLMNDMAGEPFKPPETERSVALDPAAMKVLESKKRPADNLRPNREFSASRAAPRGSRDVADRAARAVFEVEGRTPLHVRVTAFDGFDGRAWHEAPVGGPRIENPDGGEWMAPYARDLPAAFAAADTHRFKLTAPEGSLLPTPPNLARFRIAKATQPDLFGWGQDRVLRFAARSAPAGTILETDSRVADPAKLAEVEFPAAKASERLRYGEMAAGLPHGVAALAREWAAGRPAGWPQIEAVVARLKADYALAPGATHPADPLGEFLFRSRRGPSYLFATAAAILVRSLGHQTRLVTGFYAAPAAYDPATKHTPVVREDLHFWAEVMLPNGDWLVLEATPGYETPAPPASFADRVALAVSQFGAWVARHPAPIGLCLAAPLAAWAFRRRVRDRLALVWWTWVPADDWRATVAGAIRVLERRGRWVGLGRPASQSRAVWLRHAAGAAEMSRMAEWAAYGEALPAPWPAAEVRRVCRAALDTMTIRRWRDVSKTQEAAA